MRDNLQDGGDMEPNHNKGAEEEEERAGERVVRGEEVDVCL